MKTRAERQALDAKIAALKREIATLTEDWQVEALTKARRDLKRARLRRTAWGRVGK